MTTTATITENGNKNIFLYLNDIEYIISPLQRDIINLLQYENSMSRKQLVKALEKPRTTIYDNITRLIGLGIIVKFPKPKNDVGRPVMHFKLTDWFKKQIRK